MPTVSFGYAAGVVGEVVDMAGIGTPAGRAVQGAGRRCSYSLPVGTAEVDS